jgi:hypothetical protein
MADTTLRKPALPNVIEPLGRMPQKPPCSFGFIAIIPQATSASKFCRPPRGPSSQLFIVYYAKEKPADSHIHASRPPIWRRLNDMTNANLTSTIPGIVFAVREIPFLREICGYTKRSGDSGPWRPLAPGRVQRNRDEGRT